MGAMTTRIRGVLFDKDGTLVDFAATWPPAYRAIAAELADAAGDPALAERLLRLAGYDERGELDPGSLLACGTNDEIAALWEARPELAGVTDVAGRLDRVFHEFARRAPTTVADLAGLFRRLRARGLALGIATNDLTFSVETWAESAGLSGLLDFVTGADAGHGFKPEPGMVHAFCAATGLKPPEVAVVGDSVHDLKMARAAGCGLVVAVLTGVTGRDALAPDADHVLRSIADLESVLV